ncbi:MAG TPA: hypothetical protein DDY78_27015 [Planctomycetales bacterium]|jgi:hypothetical protein|nr:hypothetical protein [Planctomycetales bacterium]
MSQDRDLIDNIKTHFARKSSAQLQEIMQANDPERWSLEAIAAAGEVFKDRLAGRAEEPQIAEEEPAPPPYYYVPEELALGVLVSLLTGHRIIPYYRTRPVENPDRPLPFGPRVAWLAVENTDTEAVAKALVLRGARDATWAEGVKAAYQSSVFVTPPLGDWTLAVSTALFPPDRVEVFVKPLLERLSRQFGDAQYFCTQRDLELHVWARARQGRLVRGYGWLGQKGLTLWDEGAQTKEERDLGFHFFNPSSICESPKHGSKEEPDGGVHFMKGPLSEVKQSDSGARKDLPLPNESCVMQLALLWSIDPTTLDEAYKEPAVGLLGSVPWARAEPVDEVDRAGVTAFRGGKSS